MDILVVDELSVGKLDESLDAADIDDHLGHGAMCVKCGLQICGVCVRT